jgi:uncharacterized protein YecE (DUF72 family)
MKFGQIQHEAQLEGKSLQLPTFEQRNLSVTRPSSTRIILGAPVWGCEGWRGKIYPSNAKSKDFLKHYSRALESIEFNSTFYGLPSAERLENWCAQTPNGFLFCPKVPRYISHSRDQLQKLERWISFWKRLEIIGDHLGRVFLQLPDTYGLKDLSDLENLLRHKPQNQKLAVEFRSPEFFHEGQVIAEVCDLLLSWNAYPLISDTLGKRYSLHQTYLGSETMIRFLGRERRTEDHFRLKQWVNRLVELQSFGMERVYFFVHQPDETHCAESLSFVSHELSKHSLLKHKTIQLLNDEAPTLF